VGFPHTAASLSDYNEPEYGGMQRLPATLLSPTRTVGFPDEGLVLRVGEERLWPQIGR